SFKVNAVNPLLTAVGPARLWVGLKNSDDVGTRFDLLVEILRNGSVIGSGQASNVPGGSSGFKSAILDTFNLALAGPVAVYPGDTLTFRLSVRISTASGHRSGTARLWFADSAANSRFTATIKGVTTDYYLLSNSALGTSAGTGLKETIDATLDRG